MADITSDVQGTTIGTPIDLSQAKEVEPSDNVQRSGTVLSGLQKAGVGLARNLICLILIAFVLLTILIAFNEARPSSEVASLNQIMLETHAHAMSLPASSPEQIEFQKSITELARGAADSRQAQRAFWIQFSQMILLNLLLPVLTAILGYVFGTSSTSTTESKS